MLGIHAIKKVSHSPGVLLHSPKYRDMCFDRHRRAGIPRRALSILSLTRVPASADSGITHATKYEDDSFQPLDCHLQFVRVPVYRVRVPNVSRIGVPALIVSPVPIVLIGLLSQVDNADVKWIKFPDTVCKFWEMPPFKNMYDIELRVKVKDSIVGAGHMDICAGVVNAVVSLGGATRFVVGNKELAHGDALSTFNTVSLAKNSKDSFAG